MNRLTHLWHCSHIKEQREVVEKAEVLKPMWGEVQGTFVGRVVA